MEQLPREKSPVSGDHLVTVESEPGPNETLPTIEALRPRAEFVFVLNAVATFRASVKGTEEFPHASEAGRFRSSSQTSSHPRKSVDHLQA